MSFYFRMCNIIAALIFYCLATAKTKQLDESLSQSNKTDISHSECYFLGNLSEGFGNWGFGTVLLFTLLFQANLKICKRGTEDMF